MSLIIQKVAIPSVEQLAFLVGKHPYACWLDSADPAHPRSRYSLVVLDPLAIFMLDQQGRARLDCLHQELAKPLSNPEGFLESWLHTFCDAPDELPFFSGGLLGFLSYESYEQRFRWKAKRRVPDFPDACWFLVDTGLVIDHQQEQAWVFSRGISPALSESDAGLAQNRCQALLQKLNAPVTQSSSIFQGATVRCDMSREQYFQKVKKIQEALQRGDCYQVNFAQCFQVDGNFDPASLYLRLRQISPAPQMAFFNAKNFQILSASPETLLEIEAGNIRSFPIKGTAPRHQDLGADLAEQKKLWDSPKDASELLMIVDMVRNDLGKICHSASVKTQTLKSIESFAQVHHLVAEIEGRLKEDVSALQALQEISPGASITGAPKLKAIEMIDQLEESARGIYTGSIGCISFDGRSSFNIAIRTLYKTQNQLFYSAGGGIVVDSDIEREYEESLLKAKAFFQILS